MRAEEARRRVSEARVARFATIGQTGRPRLVPFCFALEGEVVYSAIDHKPKSTPRPARLSDIAADGRVAVLVDHYEDDWDRLWWVRLEGTALELAPGAGSAPALELLTAKYEQYRRHPPAGPVIAIAIERWLSWSAR